MARVTRLFREEHRRRRSPQLALLLIGVVMTTTIPRSVAYGADQPGSAPAVQPAEPSPADLQRFVAPIALYPDELVAQVLAAATYPEQVVEANRWVQQHAGLQGAELAKEVDAQPWDPSVKALAQFPSVLGNMDKNLSWTSALGDAYVNHPQDVMDAVQAMRRRAKDAGHLQTTSQQKVVEEGSQIVIQPANPQIVYVPAYDPWLVYGVPVVAWPGWYPFGGVYFAGPGVVFGLGFDIGFFGGFGWGWGHWGCDWHRRTVVFNHNTFISNGRTFINRGTFARERGGFGRAGGSRTLGPDRGPGSFHAPPARGMGGGGSGGGDFAGGERHAFAAPREAPEGHWGAFSGFDHGGATRDSSERGSSSFGFHGFGGASHGGGFGGGRR